MDIQTLLTQEFHLAPWQVENTVKLIDEGNTIPFIARYRKEATGELDDQLLRELEERLAYLRGLEKRKAEVLASIESQGALTQELSAALSAAATLAAVEDLYRPYRPKRRTRASMAREKGLAPLAETLLAQSSACPDPLQLAAAYVDPEKEVESPQAALDGAVDIIAEQVSDDAAVRQDLRAFINKKGAVRAIAADPAADSVYTNYYDYTEPVARIAGHRVLALNRGEAEGCLKVSVELPEEEGIALAAAHFLRPGSAATPLVQSAVEDGCRRLLFPSLEREVRSALSETAQEGAIRVFAQNLRQLLLQPPIKGKVCLAMDPGYRNGCKLAAVDPFGKVLETGVIYPAPPFSRTEEAKRTVKRMVKAHGVEVFAIGNGTASKETELFAAEVIRELGGTVGYVMVSEAGASVYSASKLAAEEFPDYDVNVRSAISIARRLQDPLAELVKIDPKAVGVGQYQHDMPRQKLDEALDGVVESCVNTVGVDLNTASPSLLAHVAGLGGATARNIVKMREENGPFTSRRQLLKVQKLGPKAFQQCAGFLRIAESRDPLDATSVHPESYEAARRLLELCGYSPEDVRTGAVAGLEEKAAQIGPEELARRLEIGLPTLRDIIGELLRPGRDMREDLPAPILRTDVMGMEDLVPGMELKGTVRNVVDFGAFVDIGVHQDGLVHISQITDRFIRHPGEVLKVGDVVTVWVLSVDIGKKRISLTMKRPPAPPQRR